MREENELPLHASFNPSILLPLRCRRARDKALAQGPEEVVTD
jgi:hypothetical protein